MAKNNEKKPPLFQGDSWENYKEFLISKEAAGRKVTPHSLQHHNQGGYLGIYQLGVSALEDAGFLKPGTSDKQKKDKLSQKAIMQDSGNWAKGYSYDSFVKDKSLQDKALKAYTQKNYNSMKGTLDKKGLTSSNDVYATLTTAHLGGAGNAIDLMNGKRTGWTDGNGTSMQSYKNAFYKQSKSPDDHIKSYQKSKEYIDEISNDPNRTEKEKNDLISDYFGEMTEEQKLSFNTGRETLINQKKEALNKLNDTSTDEGFMYDLLKKNRLDWGTENNKDEFSLDLGSLSKEEHDRLNSILKDSDKFNNIKLQASGSTGSGSYAPEKMDFKITGSHISNLIDPIDQLHLDGTGDSLFYNRYTENLDGDDPQTADPSRNVIKKEIKSKYYNSNIISAYNNELEVKDLQNTPTSETVEGDLYTPEYIEQHITNYRFRNDGGGSGSSSRSVSKTGYNINKEDGTVGDPDAKAKDNQYRPDILNEFLTRESRAPMLYGDDLNKKQSFGDFLSKNPTAVASMGLAVKGMIDANKPVQDLDVNDRTFLSTAFDRHFDLLEDMKNKGFTPAEEAAHLKKINDGFNASMQQVVRASGGNRNVILSQTGGLNANRNDALLNMAVADAQLRRENIKNFEDVLFYQEQFNEKKDIRRQNNEYRSKLAKREQDLQTRATGAQLASDSIKSLITSIEDYKQTGPGSAYDMMEQYMKASIKQKMGGINPDTGRVFQNEQEYLDYEKRETAKAERNESNQTLFKDHLAKSPNEKQAMENAQRINTLKPDQRADFYEQYAPMLGEKDFDLSSALNDFMPTLIGQENEQQDSVPGTTKGNRILTNFEEDTAPQKQEGVLLDLSQDEDDIITNQNQKNPFSQGELDMIGDALKSMF